MSEEEKQAKLIAMREQDLFQILLKRMEEQYYVLPKKDVDHFGLDYSYEHLDFEGKPDEHIINLKKIVMQGMADELANYLLEMGLIAFTDLGDKMHAELKVIKHNLQVFG